MGFRKKLLLILVPLTIFSIGAAVLVSANIGGETIRRIQTDHLGGMADKIREELALWVADRERDAMT